MDARGLPLMAYSPMEQGRIPEGGALGGDRRPARGDPLAGGPGLGAAPARRHRHPQGGQGGAYARQNQAAPGLRLSEQELARLDAQFAPPRRTRPLEML